MKQTKSPKSTDTQAHTSAQAPMPTHTGEPTYTGAQTSTGAGAQAGKQTGTPIRPLTRKQAALVQTLVRNPTLTQRDAYRQVYNAEGMSDRSVDVEATRTLRKPHVRLELDKYSSQAESTVLEIMNYSREYGRTESGSKEQGSAYAAVSLRAAESVLDRVHGKATQRVEQTSKAVSINIDLTGVVDTQAEGHA